MSKVSLIVPVLNDREMLLGFIDQIRAQSYKNVGVYIIDGGSTDGSERYATHHYMGTAPKGPPRTAEQRNLGTKVASGSILIHTDCDIRFQDTGQLGRIVEWITEPSFDIGSPKITGYPGWTREMYRRYVYPICATMIMGKRIVFEKVNGFRAEVWQHTLFDIDVRQAGYYPQLVNETIIHTRPLTKNLPLPQKIKRWTRKDNISVYTQTVQTRIREKFKRK